MESLFCYAKIWLVVALVVLFGVSLYVYKTNNVNETYENKESKEVNYNMLSVMLEIRAETDVCKSNDNLSNCIKNFMLVRVKIIYICI